MEAKKRNTITLISLLLLLVIVTTVFVLAFTFGGTPEAPDAIATYTRNKLTWSGVNTDSEGIADLNIFGDPEPGETMPIIHPYSKDTYYLRLKNDVSGKIGYSIYFYTDTTTEIPLVFDVVGESTPVLSTPSELEGKQIVSSFSGTVDGRNMKNFEIQWQWDSESDLKDTELGNKAVTEDLIYTIKVLIVIEDNNSYSSGSGSSGVRLLHRKYIAGYPEGDFRPENNIARSEVSAIFARILADYDENNLTSIKTDFTDVSTYDWSAKYIAKLEKSGIIKGYDDGSFKPNSPITRAEFATICVRYFESRAGEINNESSDFTDVNEAHWASVYIDKAQAQGFITGYPDGSFKPDNYITRAEVVTVVNRMLSRYPDKKYIDGHDDEIIKFSDVLDKDYWAYYEIYEAGNSHYTRVNGKSEGWISVIGEDESSATVVHRKYISGYPDGTFKAENNIARSEAAAIFARILSNYDEDNISNKKSGFSDVKKGKWYSKYIAMLENTGIINGYDDGSFKPNNNITRAEFAAICVRYYESTSEEITNAKSNFTDVDKKHWAKEYIDKAQKQGFVTGYPDGTFKPDNYITRAEVVTVVNRMLYRTPDKDYIDTNVYKLTRFDDVTDKKHWAYYQIFEAANQHTATVAKNTETWLNVTKAK